MGEGVNDYGGPYRAVFEQVMDEIQDDRAVLPPAPNGTAAAAATEAGRTSTSQPERCLLPLLVPCPNRAAAVGANQEKFVLSPGAPSPSVLELVHFLGKLCGTAVRHGLPMGLDLPATVWRPLVGLPLDRAALAAVDLLAVKALEQVEQAGVAAEAAASGRTPRATVAARRLVPEGWEDLTFTTHLSDGSLVTLPAAAEGAGAGAAGGGAGGGAEGAEGVAVTRANWREYVRLVELVRLKEGGPLLAAFQVRPSLWWCENVLCVCVCVSLEMGMHTSPDDDEEEEEEESM